MKFKSLAALLSAGILAAVPFINTSADAVPMTMKELDKSYLTLVFDDNNTSLKTFYDIITLEYGYPICAAVPSSSLKGDNSVLHDIENHGGEILSHTKTHKVFNRDVAWEVVDSEMKDSLNELTAAGFNVKGIILAGGGGTEDTDLEYRTEIEKITSKYYYYSDLYGVQSNIISHETILDSPLTIILKSHSEAFGSLPKLHSGRSGLPTIPPSLTKKHFAQCWMK